MPPDRRGAGQFREFGVSISVVVVARPTVVVLPRERYWEQDGKKGFFGRGGELAPLPDDAEVVFEGDPVDDSKFEVITVLQNTHTDPKASVILAGDRVVAAALGVAILSRVPLDRFKASAAAVRAGSMKASLDFVNWGERYQDLVEIADERE